jgi:divalent metal cation (Fe/Co/Zn/Cd) transporter
MQMDRTLRFAFASLSFNIAFASYHVVMGLVTSSWWLLTLGSYYLVLTVVRFVVLRSKSKERFVTKFTGWMLILLSIPLFGTVILSVVRDRGHERHMIVMIAMAVYAFTKITLATINVIKARHSTSATLITLRNISFADAFVSIFALQRSMLVSFEGMTEAEIVIMNATLGSAVCVIVLLLGINLLRSKKLLFRTLNA